MGEWTNQHPRWRTYFDDLVQECLEYCWKGRSEYESKPRADQERYLRRIAKNRIKEYLRAEHAQRRAGNLFAEELPDSDTVLGIYEPDEPLRRALEGALKGLPEKQKTICLRLMEGFSKSDIARKLGISRQRLYQELETIRRRFVREGVEKFFSNF